MNFIELLWPGAANHFKNKGKKKPDVAPLIPCPPLLKYSIVQKKLYHF